MKTFSKILHLSMLLLVIQALCAWGVAIPTGAPGRVGICDLGLRRMAMDDFRRDYRMLLDPGSAMTHCLANLARELGILTAPEAEAIAGLFPPDGAVLVSEMARRPGKIRTCR